MVGRRLQRIDQNRTTVTNFGPAGCSLNHPMAPEWENALGNQPMEPPPGNHMVKPPWGTTLWESPSGDHPVEPPYGATLRSHTMEPRHETTLVSALVYRYILQPHMHGYRCAVSHRPPFTTSPT